ncbi:LPS export ABC transporter permease LptG [Sphingomonas morindae]|uniref:LPS export ABC transporter permease LptG n=1 Tax=Sphingomonas morindae TaxID=1541170 RepID=A0ABY4X8D0_9SPHN|nr:LPS export ABC transporter permease LptG [Sphingomonas morindae]USI73198.1 LPS export ABC transporter permease LptG [Sphingomonas morindae]
MIQLSFFSSRTLALYMARTFLVRTVAVLAALVVVLQTLDLLGESGDILAYPGNGDAALWHYVALRLPQIVARFLPFSVLLGTLITLVSLNQNSEVIAMKAGGVSAHQILAPLVVASLAIAGFSFAFNERLVTRASATLDRWQAVDYGPLPAAPRGAQDVWVRAGDDIIHAASAGGRGAATRLAGVTIYSRQAGALRRIIIAPQAQARLDQGRVIGWRATGAKLFDVVSGRLAPPSSFDFGAGVSPEQFTLSNVSADDRSLLQLGQEINELDAAGRPTGPLKAGWWHKISGPLSAVLMPLLAGTAAFGLARSGALFVRAVIGMVLGFAYFVADNFALAMGNLGAYPPLLAAWAPFFLFLMIGETVLVRTEE